MCNNSCTLEQLHAAIIRRNTSIIFTIAEWDEGRALLSSVRTHWVGLLPLFWLTTNCIGSQPHLLWQAETPDLNQTGFRIQRSRSFPHKRKQNWRNAHSHYLRVPIFLGFSNGSQLLFPHTKVIHT